MSRELALFLTAVQFLTRVPTPAIRSLDAGALALSVRYFPLVGVLVGLVNAGIWWAASRCFPTSVSTGIMLAASALLTGALHEDGFADACDAFGAGATRERVLAIMKDSRIGAYGAIGLILMLGLKWAAIAALPFAVVPLLLVAAHMISRWYATGLIWRLAYVRTEESRSRPFTGRLSGAGWILSGLIGIAGLALVAAGMLRSGAGTIALDAELLGAGAIAAAAVTLLAAGYFRHRIGGYTGDCLGAAQQLAELTFLLAGLAALPRR